MKRSHRWIHLDCKGLLPELPRLKSWVMYLAELGFNGLVIEYEDRIDLPSTPGVFRRGYTHEQWADVHATAQDAGLEVVPLIQTIGHLEYVLRLERYAPLREAGQWNELCACHPESMSFSKNRIDDIIALHPHSKFIHLGADETWHLGSCERCAAAAKASGLGALGSYIQYVGELCRYCQDKGVTPMIWADMLWRHGHESAAAQLPESVILVDWQYGGVGPFDSTRRLTQTDRRVWGASAIRSGYDPMLTLAPLQERIDNALGWNRQLESGQVQGVIHTFWGKQASLRPDYGPWEAWLPAVIAAGDPDAWESHPMRPIIAKLDAAMLAPVWADQTSIYKKLDALESKLSGTFEADTLAWWRLALEHKQIVKNVTEAVFWEAGMRGIREDRGVDPMYDRQQAERADELLNQIGAWEGKAESALMPMSRTQDTAEFLQARVGGLKHLLNELPRH